MALIIIAVIILLLLSLDSCIASDFQCGVYTDIFYSTKSKFERPFYCICTS